MSNTTTFAVQTKVAPAAVTTPAKPDVRRIETLRPRRSLAWNAYVRTHAEGTFFHTLAWRDAVKEAFHLEAIYLSSVRGERITGVLPMFLISSRLAGRMLISVPYGVGGGIIADDNETVQALFDEARRIADTRGCTSIELRSERAMVPNLLTVNRHVGFQRELPERADEVLGFLPRKARAAARNARNKYKLTVSYGDEQLEEVWRLYTMSMRRLASINYPFSFFKQLIAHSPGQHWVSLVRSGGRPVAGLITFLFKDRVMPYFIGTTHDAKRCSAANFIYLTAMERGVEHGYRTFDFGRSRRDNKGSFDFKRFQGFEPRPLGYQTYTSDGSPPPNLSPDNPKFRMARRVWSHLPLWVTRPLGVRLSKHVPG